MSKRLKRVYSSSSQVYHLWANQTQSDARSSFRASFVGTSAYSYRTEVARIVKYKGYTIGVVSSVRYSNTTRKHQGELVNALDGLMYCVLSSDLNDVKKGLIETQEALVNRIFDVFNRRSFYTSFDSDDFKWLLQTDAIDKFNNGCEALGHTELRLVVPQDLKDVLKDHIKASVTRTKELQSPEAQAKRDALHRKRQEKEMQKHAEELAAWRYESGPVTNFIRNLKPQLLRLMNTQQGWAIQTSSGAVVDVQSASILLKRLLAGTKKVTGLKVGDFTVTSYDRNSGIVAIGCHRIHIDEAKNLFKEKLEVA